MVNGCTREESTPGPPAPAKAGILHARTYHSGFAQAHDTYNVMLAASDGKIYYVNSIAVGKDGTVYTLARITEQGQTRTDLTATFTTGPLR
jgi:hypothetical protein